MANRADSTLLINGGAVDLSAQVNNFRLIQEGFPGITSTITIDSGSLSCNLLDLAYDAEADPTTVFGTGIINLNGGFLALNRFNRSAASDPGQTSFTINLNGGTLRCRNSNANFLPDLADTQVIVKAGGAKFDTNTFTSTVSAPLLHDPALGASLDGGVTKENTGSLTLTGANDFSGGFTNNGSGNVYPNSNSAFGTGPVVSNGGSIYPVATVTIANSLALNNTTLRIGGGASHILNWNGPVTVTGTSGLSADNGTTGITLGSTLDITGATFNSYANNTANNINGNISGAGGNLNVTGGTLQLSGIGSYTGTTTLSGSAILRLQPAGTIPNSTNVVINGSGNFNVRNTVGWIYTGTITGDDTGSINLNSGTDAELAGPISGLLNINANSVGTDTTISGNISGATNVNVQNTGAPILRLAGNNSYGGNTTIANTGTLVLESANALPDVSPLSIANGTLMATVVGTDSAGPLNVTSTATINLASGAKLAFADSSGTAWVGTLDITGDFVSGSSLKFGTDANGLTPTQITQITATGFTGFGLDSSGFLTASAAGSPYDTWKSQITNGLNLRTDDADGDGFNNLQEFLFGSSPVAGNGSLVTTTTGGGNIVLRWLQRETGSTYTLTQSSTLGVGSWSTAAQVPAIDGDQTGAPTDYDYFTVTLPIGSGKLFYRIEGVEN